MGRLFFEHRFIQQFDQRGFVEIQSLDLVKSRGINLFLPKILGDENMSKLDLLQMLIFFYSFH